MEEHWRCAMLELRVHHSSSLFHVWLNGKSSFIARLLLQLHGFCGEDRWKGPCREMALWWRGWSVKKEGGKRRPGGGRAGRAAWPCGRSQMLPQPPPHPFPPFVCSMAAVFLGAGGAGRQSVMSCQQRSDGSLTYFRKYHRIAIYNPAEQHGSSHVPGGPEHTQIFSNLNVSSSHVNVCLLTKVSLCGKNTHFRS